MGFIKKYYFCPNCKNKLSFKIYDELNEEHINKILNRKIFTKKCKKCSTSITVDYSLVLKTQKYTIYYTPGEENFKKEHVKVLTRVCDTYDDFKEKILIFQDELNDVLIEFIKAFIISQLNKDEREILDNIRYDSKNNNELLFYLIGLNKTIYFSIDNYNSLLKKCKFKKINKKIIIDEYNYKKYIKI